MQSKGIPKLLGNRFEITAPAAKGSMGTVYRGFDRKLKRTVALKRLDLTSQPDGVDPLQEARVLAASPHPNILGIYDIINEQESFWLVTEWIDGSTLDGLPLPL